MKYLLSKGIAIGAISVTVLPALAMDSVVIERFYLQSQEPLNMSHESAKESNYRDVDEDSEINQKNMRKNEDAHHDNMSVYYQRRIDK
ncbi:hypothetical protein DFO67_11041 [Modicisalibacter xianhensis]|uniref:Uncharacterized protein n=1 Tax=Modicisalibacter xianhensis TaxID=442341 RepID=A0A4R8FWA0_9GAMM|nr:hypothetical protein [Halomonas xianhensis]TDX28341.1 hypothetical protein DFO67_11041 [Halomonas xianhensis]